MQRKLYPLMESMRDAVMYKSIKSLNGFTCYIKSPRLSVNGIHIMIQRCVFRKHLEGFRWVAGRVGEKPIKHKGPIYCLGPACLPASLAISLRFLWMCVIRNDGRVSLHRIPREGPVIVARVYGGLRVGFGLYKCGKLERIVPVTFPHKQCCSGFEAVCS